MTRTMRQILQHVHELANAPAIPKRPEMITAESLIDIMVKDDGVLRYRVMVGKKQVAMAGTARSAEDKAAKIARFLEPAIPLIHEAALLGSLKDCPVDNKRLAEIRVVAVELLELDEPRFNAAEMADLLRIIDHQRAVIALMARDQA